MKADRIKRDKSLFCFCFRNIYRRVDCSTNPIPNQNHSDISYCHCHIHIIHSVAKEHIIDVQLRGVFFFHHQTVVHIRKFELIISNIQNNNNDNKSHFIQSSFTQCARVEKMSGKRQHHHHRRSSFNEAALSGGAAAGDGGGNEETDDNEWSVVLNRVLTQPIVDAEAALVLDERLAKGACK
jgi:hypothetical protein